MEQQQNPKCLPSKQFEAMTPQQRQKYVESFKISDKDFQNLVGNSQYPEKQFIHLEGIQYGKTIKLATFRYPSQINPHKGVIAILNSYYMHSKYTSHLAKKLSQSGFIVVTYDMRGHGLSEGQRGQWNDYKGIIKQAYDFLKSIQKLYPKTPIFILGWGNSALNLLYICLYYYNQFNFAGVIMASTLFKIPAYGKTFQIVGNIALRLLNILPTRIGVYSPNFDFFTKYKKVSKMLHDDKLNISVQTSVCTVLQVNELLDDIPQRLWDKIDTPPIIILHGQHDKYGNGYNSYIFYNKIKSKDKQLWYYPQMQFGGFLFDDQYYQISQRLIKWLQKHSKIWFDNQQSKKECEKFQ